MVYEFSEESTFVLKNWRIIEDLTRSVGIFRNEFKEYLYSLEDMLKNGRDWWNDNVHFVKHRDDQVYISKKSWEKEGEDLIWIGVERFNPESVLGYGNPAQCYLWVTGSKCDKIKEDLIGLLNDNEDLTDKLTYDIKRYVLIEPVTQYNNDEYVDFVSGSILEEIANFFETVYTAIKDYEIR